MNERFLPGVCISQDRCLVEKSRHFSSFPSVFFGSYALPLSLAAACCQLLSYIFVCCRLLLSFVVFFRLSFVVVFVCCHLLPSFAASLSAVFLLSSCRTPVARLSKTIVRIRQKICQKLTRANSRRWRFVRVKTRQIVPNCSKCAPKSTKTENNVL